MKPETAYECMATVSTTPKAVGRAHFPRCLGR